jgi:hypothetical protein
MDETLVCPYHSGIIEQTKSLTKRMDKMEDRLFYLLVLALSGALSSIATLVILLLK